MSKGLEENGNQCKPLNNLYNRLSMGPDFVHGTIYGMSNKERVYPIGNHIFRNIKYFSYSLDMKQMHQKSLSHGYSSRQGTFEKVGY